MSVLAHGRSVSAKRSTAIGSGTARPLLCFIYSPTSGPSRRAEGFLAQVLQRRKNHQAFVIQRINCDERPDLVAKLGAKTVPSLVVVENRRVRARLEGVSGCKNIEQLLEPWLGASDEATPPAPAPVPEPYPPPDELDLPIPDRDTGEDDGGQEAAATAAEAFAGGTVRRLAPHNDGTRR